MKSKKTRYEKELERGALYDEILTVIFENDFTKWSELRKFYEGQPKYISLLSSRPALIREVLKSNWREQNPNGKVLNVKIIEKKDGIMKVKLGGKKGEVMNVRIVNEQKDEAK